MQGFEQRAVRPRICCWRDPHRVINSRKTRSCTVTEPLFQVKILVRDFSGYRLWDFLIDLAASSSFSAI